MQTHRLTNVVNIRVTKKCLSIIDEAARRMKVSRACLMRSLLGDCWGVGRRNTITARLMLRELKRAGVSTTETPALPRDYATTR